MSSYQTYEYKYNAFERWDADGRKSWNKPTGIERLGWAAPKEDRPNGYKAYLFRQRGKAILAIGCRRYTLSEAYAHWDGIRSVSVSETNDRELIRKRRANYICNTVLRSAARRANDLGWKI